MTVEAHNLAWPLATFTPSQRLHSMHQSLDAPVMAGWQWLLLAVGVIAALVVVLAWVGRFRRRRHERAMKGATP